MAHPVCPFHLADDSIKNRFAEDGGRSAMRCAPVISSNLLTMVLSARSTLKDSM